MKGFAVQGWGHPYQKWEKREEFATKDGRVLYPLFAPEKGGQPNHILVFDVAVDPSDPDVELRLRRRHCIGSLDWVNGRISYVHVEDGGVEGKLNWRNQGVATRMFELARKECPDLRHAHCKDRISVEGELFVRATSPEEACNNQCGDGCRKWRREGVAQSQSASIREKLKRFFRRMFRRA